jgi:thioredoxin reductase
MTNVAIIGAGPYGLSLAAHLRAAGVEFAIFGEPMSVWRDHMPMGMQLKSDGCASNLYDPAGAFSLRSYCESRSIAYADRGLPVALDTFIAYGLAFQKRFVPDLDRREVVRLEQRPQGGFLVHASCGEPVAARNVVVAVGISHFQHTPALFADLPPALLSHSRDHNAAGALGGRDVVVVGAGASALDTAALLHRGGSNVVLVARRKAIAFIEPPRDRLSLIERIRKPPTGIGPGWKNVLCTELPLAFYFLPEAFRREVVRRHLGPAPGWSVREQTEGRFPFVLGATPVAVRERNGRVRMELAMHDGSARSLDCDHVVAATGYKVDLRRLAFLGDDLRDAIDAVDRTPRLSMNFESSVPGLYFIGLAAANTFGPVLRFAFGAKFAVPHLTRHLARPPALRPTAAAPVRPTS